MYQGTTSWTIAASACCLLLAIAGRAVAGETVQVAVGHQPQSAVDANGRILLVYVDDQNTIWLTGTEDGRIFSAPTRVAKPRQKIALGMRRGPRIVATPDALVITYIAGDSGGGKDENLFSIRSTDGGKTWSDPQRINGIDRSAREGLHAMCADAPGNVLCVWLDNRDGRMEVYGARSPDAGRNWGPNTLIYRAPKDSICDCCPPTIIADGERGAIVMFRNDIDGNRDMYVIRSSDMQHFSEAVKLGEKSWTINGCPMDGGAMASASSAAHAVYRRQSELYLVDLEKPQHETSLGEGANAVMILDRAAPTIAYLSRPGRGDLMVARSGKPTKVAEQAQDPVLVAASSGRLLIWESNGRILATPLGDDPTR